MICSNWWKSLISTVVTRKKLFLRGNPKLFLREWWPEIVRGHQYKNPRWHEVYLAKQDTKNLKIHKRDILRLDSILKFAFHLISHHLLTINENCFFLIIYVTNYFSFLFHLKWPEIDKKHPQWSKIDYHMPNIHSQRFYSQKPN